MATSPDLVRVLADLASHHAAAAALAKEAYDLAVAGQTPKRSRSIAADADTARQDSLVVSIAMCSVRWRGRCCVLGPSLPLRLIHRLATLRLGRYNAAYVDAYRCDTLDGFAQLALRARIERPT